jgi:hypothetical protein
VNQRVLWWNVPPDAIAVATKARTVENVLKGGIVLLFGGLLSSPLVLLIG